MISCPARSGGLAPLVLAALAALATAACAGGDTSLSVRCENACERDRGCDLEVGSPFCADTCIERSQELVPAFRDAYLDCYAETGCPEENPDDLAMCENEAGNLVDRRPSDETFTTDCQAVNTDCEEGFDVDFCFVSHYYVETVVETARGCLTMTCDAIEGCLRRELAFAPFSRGD